MASKVRRRERTDRLRPLIHLHRPDSRRDVCCLTFFRTEVTDFGSPPDTMVNTPPIARGTYGKGRLFVSSAHPEQTPGLEGWIEKTVRAVAGE